MMAGLSNHERAAIDELYRLIGPAGCATARLTPTPKQEAFLRLTTSRSSTAAPPAEARRSRY